MEVEQKYAAQLFQMIPSSQVCRKTEVKTREQQLQDLDARLRQANERLKRLESKHKRMQSENILSSRGRDRNAYSNSSDSEFSQGSASSDGHSSPTQDPADQH